GTGTRAAPRPSPAEIPQRDATLARSEPRPQGTLSGARTRGTGTRAAPRPCPAAIPRRDATLARSEPRPHGTLSVIPHSPARACRASAGGVPRAAHDGRDP